MNIIVFNSEIEQPLDKKILLKDVLENNSNIVADKKMFVFDKKSKNGCVQIGVVNKDGYEQGNRVYGINGKHPTLQAQGGGITSSRAISINNLTWRKLTPLECERLQTIPDNFTNCVSNNQRCKMIGNGFTIDVIAHLFSYILNKKL